MAEFAIITPTGMARAIVEGHATALRVQDYFTKQDMVLHTIRPATEADNRTDVLRNK